ncbi:hypothetical protein DPMN_080689 [Dreissena polymorpha]|uniref:Uncharacterized protein n=1 Tax=Dreissena polymorpha TaxID=45954 RepID=A0A9D3YRW0_DREPO|nr:hypothetical protein DPMN_080689 [Dreissena polymorpha]
MNASACTNWGSWSSCSKSCGGGEKTRKCRVSNKTQTESCNMFCYNGTPYNGGCRCAWRPGSCCEGCSNPDIAYCKPGMYVCGGSPDGIKCTDCYLPYKSAGFRKGCVRKPCSENTGGCSHLCTGVGGLTMCTCRAGYKLSSDEYSCIETGVFSTKVTTRDVTTTYGSSSSVSTTQKVATLATDYAFPNSKDGITEESRQTYSEKSHAVGVGAGVSVCIMFLVGGALVMVVLKRRNIALQS